MRKIFLIFILFFIIVHFTLNIENCVCQWITQDWPYFQIIKDVKFIDENTGFYTGYNGANSEFYKTTNSGFNWSIINIYGSWGINKIDSTTVYTYNIYKLFRTYNKGISWDSVAFNGMNCASIFFINQDTGWVALFDGSKMNIHITTNKGISYQYLSSIYSSWVRNLYFLKEKVNGYYIGYCSNADLVQKTTNSGYNWVTLPVLPNPPYTNNDVMQVKFINKDSGWVTNATKRIFKTTNGGQNWIFQPVPTGNGITNNGFGHFCIINEDTLYSDAGVILVSPNNYRGIVYKTTNGGNNWGYQIPDINIPKSNYFPDFINGQTGWFTNTKTTNGGGPIIFTEVKPISVNIPEEYKLNQNYPNPFNSSTVIEFTIPKESEVTLRIYDITGKLVMRVIEGFRLNRGEYRYKIESFDMSGLSSGVYFYNMTARNKYGTVFSETKKMIFSK